MTEVPAYQAWANVINSVPTYSTMGTSPAVVSSPLINPRPLVETMEDEEENTVGELAAAAELLNETLTASSATTNLPTSPSIATAHALSQRHHQRPSHRACQQALLLLNTPACSNRGRLNGNLSGPPSASAFRSACVTIVTPTARRTLDNHVQSETAFVTSVTLTVLPRGCPEHLGVLRPLPPGKSPTRNLPKIPFAAISGSLTYCPLFWVSAFSNLFAGC